MIGKYKFEKFKDVNFPVYSSTQRGSGMIVIPHYHEFAELIKIKNGSVDIIINTEKILCKKGDIVFVPPYCVHNVYGITDNTEITGLVFDFNLITVDVCGYSVKEILKKEVIKQYVVSESNDIYKHLNNSFLNAVELYALECNTYKMQMLSLLLNICTALVNNYFSKKDFKSFNRLQPVFEYIEKHLEQNIKISQLSESINVCDDYLIRLFKEATNKTPISYINDLRLQKAIKLLINTDLSITEIAYKVGFCDLNYASRLFRQKLGVTAGQYRKISKDNKNI
ncbi:MAG: helix-turn-helix domain-containing protein [Ruminococcaceae bacterium]|nr:helix-turn-helix domain-containing protein [Oscillospiraceae bacterium]